MGNPVVEFVKAAAKKLFKSEADDAVRLGAKVAAGGADDTVRLSTKVLKELATNAAREEGEAILKTSLKEEVQFMLSMGGDDAMRKVAEKMGENGIRSAKDLGRAAKELGFNKAELDRFARASGILDDVATRAGSLRAFAEGAGVKLSDAGKETVLKAIDKSVEAGNAVIVKDVGDLAAAAARREAAREGTEVAAKKSFKDVAGDAGRKTVEGGKKAVEGAGNLVKKVRGVPASGEVIAAGKVLLKDGGDDAIAKVSAMLAENGVKGAKNLGKAAKGMGMNPEQMADLAKSSGLESAKSLGNFAKNAELKLHSDELITFAKKAGFLERGDVATQIAKFSKGFGMNKRTGYTLGVSTNNTAAFAEKLGFKEIAQDAAQKSLQLRHVVEAVGRKHPIRSAFATAAAGTGAYMYLNREGDGLEGEDLNTLEIVKGKDGKEKVQKVERDESGKVISREDRPDIAPEAVRKARKEAEPGILDKIKGLFSGEGIGDFFKDIGPGKAALLAGGALLLGKMLGGGGSLLGGMLGGGLKGQILGGGLGILGGIVSFVATIALIGVAIWGGMKLLGSFSKDKGAPGQGQGRGVSPDGPAQQLEQEGPAVPEVRVEANRSQPTPDAMREAVAAVGDADVRGGREASLRDVRGQRGLPESPDRELEPSGQSNGRGGGNVS